MAGYHQRNINKGILGQFSKVQEEFEEFIDANEQNCAVMSLVELSDLMGALKHYYLTNNKGYDIQEWDEIVHYYSTQKNYDTHCDFQMLVQSFAVCCEKEDKTLSLGIFINLLNNYLRLYNIGVKDLIIMSNITERAFLSGERQ